MFTSSQEVWLDGCMPGGKYRSIKHPRMYRALKRKGYSKTKAAKISNARARGGRRKRKKH
jgi:hypothetical protein